MGQSAPLWTFLVGPAVNFCAALLAATVAWISLKTNAGVNLRNKRMDIIIHCNSRYDDLTKLRTEIDSEYPVSFVKLKSYYRRYWGLKSDQLDYWLAGYVDPETVASWFMSTTESFANGSKVGGEAYFPYWKEHIEEGHRVVNDRLVRLVNFIECNLSKIDDEATQYAGLLQYLRILEGIESRLISELSRNTHHRYRIRNFAQTLQKDELYRYNSLGSYRFYIKIYEFTSKRIIELYYSCKNAIFMRGEQNVEALCKNLKSMKKDKVLPFDAYWHDGL